MKITAMRALLAAKAAMHDAGYGHTSPYGAEMTGWIQPNYLNSTGFGIRKRPDDGDLEWNVKLSGKPHLRYRTWTERRGDGDSVDLSEPVNEEKLLAPLRKVFEGLGLDVKEVRYSGAQLMWDDDVSYIVTTKHPEWLEAYAPKNKPELAEGPTLVGLVLPFDSKVGVDLRGQLPGYDTGGQVYLTKESAEYLAAKANPMAQARFKMGEDGSLVIERGTRTPVSLKKETLTNHWGDEVEVYPATGWFEVRHLIAPVVPFVADGETHDKADFRKLDEQFAEAPWTPAAAPSPGR